MRRLSPHTHGEAPWYLSCHRSTSTSPPHHESTTVHLHDMFKAVDQSRTSVLAGAILPSLIPGLAFGHHRRGHGAHVAVTLLPAALLLSLLSIVLGRPVMQQQVSCFIDDDIVRRSYVIQARHCLPASRRLLVVIRIQDRQPVHDQATKTHHISRHMGGTDSQKSHTHTHASVRLLPAFTRADESVPSSPHVK
jgi:hypothetical protein